MASNKITTYNGERINVSWDGRLCIHIGECGQSAGDLFVGGRDPWCMPDLADDDHVRHVVRRCPSGALCYQDKTGKDDERAANNNTVKIVYNGPLYLKGELDIEHAADDMPGVRFRAALCRCGQSNNKPFCDNSHLEAGFQDAAAVGDSGEALATQGGVLRVKTVKDGPLMLSGNFAILAGSGRLAWQGTQAALCRCGHSANKPFCDGSHKTAGFVTDC